MNKYVFVRKDRHGNTRIVLTPSEVFGFVLLFWLVPLIALIDIIYWVSGQTYWVKEKDYHKQKIKEINK